MSILQPALEAIHLVRATCYYVFQFLYYVGRNIFWLLSEVYALGRELFSAFVIIGEELYRFLCELDASATAAGRYIQSSTNSGLGSVVLALRFFVNEISHFFKSTRLMTRLFATHAGSWVTAFFTLLRDALLLIADSLWWLLSIVPRLLLGLVFAVGDALVFIVNGVTQLVVGTTQALMDDIFRLTVGMVLVFLLWRHRHGVSVVLSVLWNNVKMTFSRIPFNRWAERIYRTPLPSVSNIFISNNGAMCRARLQRNHSPSPSGEKVAEAYRCVVCRDRQKCVVLLPCRHLCLCEECEDFMNFETRMSFCPLCRTAVVHTISVYV